LLHSFGSQVHARFGQHAFNVKNLEQKRIFSILFWILEHA
jgi:hypothetical protein